MKTSFVWIHRMPGT